MEPVGAVHWRKGNHLLFWEGIELFVLTTFGDSDFINRGLGVSEQESIDSGLAATELNGGCRSTGLTAEHRSYSTRKLMLTANATYEHYSGDIEDSPIARQGYEYEVGVSLVYHS